METMANPETAAIARARNRERVALSRALKKDRESAANQELASKDQQMEEEVKARIDVLYKAFMQEDSGKPDTMSLYSQS